MASLKQLQAPEMYTIGWMVALDKELTAAQAVLDEEHRRPANFRKQPKDTNNYAWGRIGDHNIVIASLAAGKIGTVSAATTAMSMISSLPHLRFGLMVGIGAGVPRLADNIDIRLGDVVVSQPTGASPGVVQYDLRKLGKDGQFKRIGALAPPPEVLLKGLTTLKASQRRKGTRLTAILDEAIQLYPRLAEPDSDDSAFVHQGTQNDRLFEASSEHIQHPNQQVGLPKATTPQDPSDQIMSQARACAHCDSRKEVKRPERRSTEPKIHYGVIASGNSVVKDGIFRDQIALNLGDKCICFEMEAAGLMDNFPCLVIRGICDYADTHKNDRWQNYAAITAAAYAKELLQALEGEDVEGARRMDEMIRNVHDLALQTHSNVKEMQQDRQFQKIVKWLAPPDVSTNNNKALEQRYGDTGQWFLRSEEYSQWKTTSKSSLWLYGIPGCGKTILSSVIIDDLRRARSYSDNLLYFYFDFSDTSKQSLENAIRSLVYQLYQKNPSTYQGYLHSLYSSCENGSRMPTVNSLNETLGKMAEHIGELWIVLDALDECQTRKGTKNEGLLPWIKDFLKGSRADIHFLLTSRPEQDIKSALNEFVERQIPIQSDLVAEDICAYIHGRVRHYEGLKRWRKRKDIQQEIEDHLMQKANGMFRWVSCQLDSLEKCPDPISLRAALKALPRTLDETYARILNKIPPAYERNATRLLQFLTFSERPLLLEEAVDVNAVDMKEKPRFNADYRMPEPDEISTYCSSLVVVVSKSDEDGTTKRELQLTHFSVKEYLISNRLERKMSLHFEERLARQCIAEVCLAYLLDLSHNLRAVKVEEDWPLAQYAARYWMTHAAQPGPNADGVRKLVWEFIQSEKSHQISFGLYDPDRPWYEGDLNSSEEVEAPLLYYMALGNVLCGVEKVLNDGADVNAQGGWYGNALQAASYEGHKEIVQILINKGADVNAESGYYGNDLYTALYEGHKGIVQNLINKGADVNAQGGKYRNALQAASLGGHKEIVEIFVNKGADVNAQGGKYRNALQATSYRGHKEIVQILVDKGADVNAQGGLYGNAFQAASYRGHKEILQVLINKGADVNAQGGKYGNALQAASSEGHKEIVQILINKGVDVNAQGGVFGNALQAASFRGHKKIVQNLINKGADVNAHGGRYGNALYTASYRGHKKIVQILVDKGADVNAQGGEYGNALQAASLGGHKEIVQILVDKGADVNAQGGEYGNALQTASFQGRKKIVQILINKGADVNAQGGEYGNALQAASYRGHKEILQILINKGADVNAQGGEYGNALQAASYRGHKEILQILINKGADVNAQGGLYGHALQAASYEGHKEIVQTLVDKGAGVNTQGGIYGNALQAASYRGHKGIVQILIDNGAFTADRVNRMRKAEVMCWKGAHWK